MSLTVKELKAILAQTTSDDSPIYQDGKPVLSVSLITGPDGDGIEIVFSTKAVE